MVWMVQSSEKVSVGGEVLSTPAAKTDGWIQAKVPSTIMGVLTDNDIEKEALTADDYAKIDKTQFDKSWWYRTTFNLPALKEGEHVLLDFDGYNAKQVSGRILTSKNVADYNDFNHPNVIAPKAFNDAKLNKGVLTVKVPAKSIVVLDIK